MNKRDLPKDRPPDLTRPCVTRFPQHFDVELRKIKEPATGQAYVDLAQLCEMLGLDLDEQRAQRLADPVLGEGVVLVEVDAPRPDTREPADLQAHNIGICTPDTCRFCR
jgi:hypothetical protein